MIAPPKPPAQDELEALIKEARARRLRRRLLGAAGLAIAAALGLSIYAFATGAGRTHTGTRSEGPAAVPLCRSSQLSASGIWDGAAGHLFNFFTIRNRGGSACVLPSGRPSAVLTRRGAPLKVDERAPSSKYFPGKPVHSLAPGERAVVHLAWWNWCGPRQKLAETTTTVTVQFGDGLSLTVPHLLGQPPCMDAAYPSVLTVSAAVTPN